MNIHRFFQIKALGGGMSLGRHCKGFITKMQLPAWRKNFACTMAFCRRKYPIHAIGSIQEGNMKKWLGVLAVVLWTGTVWAADAKVYPGARLDAAETARFHAIHAKSNPTTRAQMGQQTVYTTLDSFDQVLAYYKKTFPGVDFKKHQAKLAVGGILNEAYFQLPATGVSQTLHTWVKIQHPFASHGLGSKPRIENRTVIILIAK